MLNFCTLFDINFIFHGLGLYESLKENCKSEFTLYIFAFCDKSYKLLKDLNLPNVKVISTDELEQRLPQLKEAKQNRSKGEYCWTCASASILYCIKTFNLEQCTYLDSDIYFYQNPKTLLDEMKEKSILITEHRYTPEHDLTATSGKYCVQFVSFKNDEKGIKALNWWVNSCIEWCYNRFEDGKFGDQKYLDDWTERFEGVHVLEHLGGGVAPWNVQQYSILQKEGKIYVNDCIPVIFYHFHNVKIAKNGKFYKKNYESYPREEIVNELFYKPYIAKLVDISKDLHEKYNNVLLLKNSITAMLFKDRIKELRRKFIRIKIGKNSYLELFGFKII